MPASNVRSPVAAGVSNRARLLRFADQPLGQAFREFGPRMWPGVPWEAFLGFITSANLTDNTTTGDPRQAFHEIGVGQIPAGPRNGPAPNPDPRAANNAWGALANTPEIVGVLGHPASMVPNAWKTLPRDQAAMTIANLKRDYASVKSALAPGVRPTVDTSPWAIAMAFSSFSAGAGGAATAFNRFAPQLAGVPDSRKWGALLQALNDGLRNGTLQPGNPNHPNPFYTAMRTWQKMESARQLAQGTHGDAGFFASGLAHEDDVIAAVLAGANNQHPGHTNVLSTEQERTAATVGGIGATGWLAAAGGVAAYLNRNKIRDAFARYFGTKRSR